jgi:hypothetical protein
MCLHRDDVWGSSFLAPHILMFGAGWRYCSSLKTVLISTETRRGKKQYVCVKKHNVLRDSWFIRDSIELGTRYVQH